MDLYEWLFLNYPSREGRKVLKPTCSSGRHLAEGLPKAPEFLNSRAVSSPPLVLSLWHGLQHTVVHSESWGNKCMKHALDKMLESTDCPRRKVLPFLPKQAPALPGRQRILLQRAPKGEGDSVLIERMFSPSAFLQAIHWVHYWWVYGEISDS